MKPQRKPSILEIASSTSMPSIRRAIPCRLPAHPAGTTIQAVRVLEEKGLRSAVIEAQMECVKKAKGM